MALKDREHQNYRVCDFSGHWPVEWENDGSFFGFSFCAKLCSDFFILSWLAPVECAWNLARTHKHTGREWE